MLLRFPFEASIFLVQISESMTALTRMYDFFLMDGIFGTYRSLYRYFRKKQLKIFQVYCNIVINMVMLYYMVFYGR
jgi:hypothetical protein